MNAQLIADAPRRGLSASPWYTITEAATHSYEGVKYIYLVNFGGDIVPCFFCNFHPVNENFATLAELPYVLTEYKNDFICD